MRTLNLLTIAAALVLMSSCDANDTCKFNAKEYAERKTERLDKLVELTDAQEKEVYSLYIEQGKQIKKDIKNMKKEGFEGKRPDKCEPKANCTKRAECPKAAECEKRANGECPKVKGDCTKKAECPKAAECEKRANGECPKVKGECTKKAECPKAAECTKKAECPKVKGECPKGKGEFRRVEKCAKAPNCNQPKADCPKVKEGECGKPNREVRRPRHPRNMVTPEAHKQFAEKLNAILTPEQQQILQQKRAERKQQCTPQPECCVNDNNAPKQAK